MKQQLDALNIWYGRLSLRDKNLLVFISALLVSTLFYLMVWEPLHQGRDQAQLKLKTQQETYAWMQTASEEIRSLKGAGGKPAAGNQPIAIILENSAKISGLKQHINKIESSGKNGANVNIDSASFDQMLVWLNTLEQQHGVTVTTATIERNEQPGTVSARLSFEKLP